MASPTKVTAVDRCRVSPPPHSVPPTSLPLTFLDIPWLFFSPTQPLFFYDFPTITTAHFTQTILPNLKHSLSLTLQHFFPLAGNLVTPPPLSAEPPHLQSAESDSVFLTIAEAAETEGGDFKNLTGNHRRMAGDFRGLVPVLLTCEAGSEKQPLLAVQITVFPESGICMGFALRHVAADWRTFNNFLSEWASVSRKGDFMEVDGLVAYHDRSVIKELDPSGLITSSFLNELWKIKSTQNNQGSTADANRLSHDMVRATFVLGPQEMERIKKWILTRAQMLFGPTSAQLLLSPYVITCAFLWVCWMKTRDWPTNEGQNVDHYFGFIAGGLTRLSYTVPSTYVGNCVGFGRASASRKELLGENGIVYAAKAIGSTIKKLNGDMLGKAKNWISEWKILSGSELHVTVTGSPKVGLYGLDFGWGRPVKFEEVSIDSTGAISLCESREVVGGIEIGVPFTESKMNDFCTLFNKGLVQYCIVND
ncbi:coumaroyl-coa:anthocyanidin 3-o-glucoside-6''-o-coumaroyltransferase 2 [Phtheirospermum japonicum]|uniref:Coumaroyl-coa:anthocyanidin 3-o-glucoside-6''-o-coumaroyltransferase 2 n=1 Tax=Phtheirospermum japonicum TaxID=374723 RepID=A0A830D6R5_9LAMI|nr:coumaroyl-coa:anthocyanidin 3-o-glucoside-6''-o-coumaroyltransferase 2 [Phtheirospermum japonicum]